MDDTALGTDPAVADIHKVSPYTQMISILYLAHPTEHPIYLYMKKGGADSNCCKYQFFLFCFLINRTAPMMMPKKTARENTY